MKVFRLRGSQDYWTLYYTDGGYKRIDETWCLARNGMSVVKDWNKVEVEIVFEGEHSKNKPDIMDFGGLVGIVITSSAKDILKDLLIPYCELLPLDLKGEEVYLVNPTVILDCIDYDNSVTELCPPMYRKKTVKYVLKKGMDYPPIFRIKSESYFIFITDEFVKVLTENHLSGYNIKELWNSEE
ncbi:MAG: hypothetical protein K2H91_10010 [Lachnospiraceae bacterium]|nr:hypothetical protein [Lachnospiraceae bacterium]